MEFPRIFAGLVCKIFAKYNTPTLPKKYGSFWVKEAEIYGLRYTAGTIRQYMHRLINAKFISVYNNEISLTASMKSHSEEYQAYFDQKISIYSTSYIYNTILNKRCKPKLPPAEYKPTGVATRMRWGKDEKKKNKEEIKANVLPFKNLELSENDILHLKRGQGDMVYTRYAKAVWNNQVTPLPTFQGFSPEEFRDMLQQIMSSEVLQGLRPMSGSSFFTMSDAFLKSYGAPSDLISMLKRVRHSERKKSILGASESVKKAFFIFDKEVDSRYQHVPIEEFEGVSYRILQNKREIRILLYSVVNLKKGVSFKYGDETYLSHDIDQVQYFFRSPKFIAKLLSAREKKAKEEGNNYEMLMDFTGMLPPIHWETIIYDPWKDITDSDFGKLVGLSSKGEIANSSQSLDVMIKRRLAKSAKLVNRNVKTNTAGAAIEKAKLSQSPFVRALSSIAQGILDQNPELINAVVNKPLPATVCEKNGINNLKNPETSPYIPPSGSKISQALERLKKVCGF